MKVNQITQESRVDRRDAYQRDYDSSVSGMGRGDDHRGLRQELAHERNNIQIAINGRPWKVVAGRGTADSAEERSNLENMKQWAERKSASSGKTWTVYLTGAEVSEAANPSQQAAIAIAKKKEADSLNEFAPGDGGDSGEEDALLKFARMWYNGDDAVQQQVEQALAQQGWEIGEIESEEGGAFVVQSGDENGDSYIGFVAADLTEGVAEGSLSEKINPKTLTRGFVQEKDMGLYTLQAVGDWASRMADEPPTMEIYAMLKPEAGQRNGKQIGQLSLKVAQGRFLKDNPGAEALVAGAVDVDPAYQRKGVASAMYAFAKELGNDVIASVDQSDDAVAMWKGMRAKGVAEGSKMARHDKLAKAPKPKNQQEYDFIQKYRADLAKSYQPKKTQGVAEGDKKPEPPEADYGDDYQDMVARVKKLAGMGPLKTVYDPQKRVYRNVPTAVQPPKK
jgi:GNAT superfamily N-acetyltransferase